MNIVNIAFIITSVINPVPTELTYGIRSYYNVEERFQQTLQTIHSIRFAVPNVDIYLIEGSKLTHEMDFILESLVDVYVNINNHLNIKDAIDSKLKGYGETKQIQFIFSNYDLTKYEYIFKISGRYYLNSDFKLQELLKNNKITFCKGKSLSPPIVSTVLYMIPNKDIQLLIHSYNLILRLYEEYEYRMLRGDLHELHYEKIVPKLINEYTIINSIGVEGLVSSYKKLYKC